MKKKSFIVLILLIASFTLFACTNKKQNNSEGKISVMVTISPLKEFAEAIGGEKIVVEAMVPEGSEPHDFEPKPKDLAKLNSSNIFVYNGLGMEDWLDKVLETIEDKEKVQVVDSSKDVEIIKTEGKLDPHIWLSLKEAKTQALNIKNALVKVDEKNKEFYEKNYNKLAKDMDQLLESNNKRFGELKNKDFVTGHAAFGYLCRDFGLEQKSVENLLGEEGEPTPQQLKEIVEFSKKNNIKTIFMENAGSAKLSETLAKEVGANVKKIYTIESKEDNKSYIEAMTANLDNIYDSLK